MNRTMKHVVLGAVPAMCGAVAGVAAGEKIAWVEPLSARESFPQAVAAASRPAPVANVPVAPPRVGVGGIGGQRR